MGASEQAGDMSVRTTAAVVGTLFIIATGLYMGGQAIYDGILGSPDYLTLAHPERARVIAGLLVELVGILAIPLIAVFVFPVLRSHSHGLAQSYIVLRLLEAVPLIMVYIGNFALVEVSRSYLEAGGGTVEPWQGVAIAITAINGSAFLISVTIIFPLGALVLNSVLWRARLVPRFISGWGFAAAALLLGGSLLSFFGVFAGASPIVLEVVLAGPIALQEMALAGWLIAKGFNAGVAYS